MYFRPLFFLFAVACAVPAATEVKDKPARLLKVDPGDIKTPWEGTQEEDYHDGINITEILESSSPGNKADGDKLAKKAEALDIDCYDDGWKFGKWRDMAYEDSFRFCDAVSPGKAMILPNVEYKKCWPTSKAERFIQFEVKGAENKEALFAGWACKTHMGGIINKCDRGGQVWNFNEVKYRAVLQKECDYDCREAPCYQGFKPFPGVE